ncbi:MAG TPA: aspartyl protease family protein [Candidatus Cybelea sp.]|nr:aspartyl protease family protein [Candidatus Cybelea sp.]
MKCAIALLAAALACGVAVAQEQRSPGESLFSSGEFAQSAAADRAWLQRHPGDINAQLRLGSVRLYENRVDAAEPLVLAVISKQPNNARATRLLAEINRRQEEARRSATVDGESAQVPFVTASPLPVIRVVANGHPANFLIDTGADVIVDPAFAASIGVVPYGHLIGTFAGKKQAPVQSGMLHSLSLGGATASEVPVHVLPTHLEQFFPKLKVDGIVGTTLFERFLVTIDYPNNRLVLRPRSARVSAAFEAASAKDASEPFYLAGDHFVFAHAQVNDAPPGLFLFDSGLAGGGLMPSTKLLAAAQLTLDTAHQSVGAGGGGAVVAIPLRADRIAVGTAVRHDVPGLYTPEGSPLDLFPFTASGIISNDFLRNYAFTVDFDAMRVVLAGPATTSIAQIFERTFARLQSYPVPPYAIWTATWHTRAHPMGYYSGESSSVDVNRYAVRLSDGMENVSAASTNGKLPPATIEPEFLGPFAWMLRSSVKVAPRDDEPSMVPDIAGFKTIAHVVAVANPSYTFNQTPSQHQTPSQKLEGSLPIENVEGRQAYHLELHPTSKPLVHNLRDLWIDVATYDLLEARFVGTYRPVPQAPISATEATVYFREVLGCWVVTRSLWNYDDPPIRYQFDVQNDEIGLPATLPDWLFDQTAYDRRVRAGDADYLGQVLEGLRKGGAAPTPYATPTP